MTQALRPLLGLVALAAASAAAPAQAEDRANRVLYVTHSAGYRHDVLPLSQSVLTQLGETSGAFALTEPFFAGADPTVIGTTATKDGDEWVIDGRKWFITNASVADIVLVFAETNPEGRPHRHASVFVVPRGTPGMEIVRDIGTMAHPEVEYGRLGNHAEIAFHHCRVPADHLIGHAAGTGASDP